MNGELLRGVLRDVLGWHVVQFSSPASQPVFVCTHYHAQELATAHVEPSEAGDMAVRIGPGVHVIQVSAPVEAKLIRGADQVVPPVGQALVAVEGDLVTMHWKPGGQVSTYRMNQFALERVLGSMIRGKLEEPLHCEKTMDLRQGRGLSWNLLWHLLIAESSRPGALIEDPWWMDEFERSLVMSFLHIHPHNYMSRLRTKSGGRPAEVHDADGAELAWPAYLRNVLRMMESHPDWDHTTETLSKYAAISERALQLRFKQHLNVSPMTHLRNIRLDHVHDALLKAVPGEVKLEQVVRRWGFQHYGHFASLYRQRFNERPSETLSRPLPIGTMNRAG